MKEITNLTHALARFGMGSLLSFFLDSMLFVILTKAGMPLLLSNILARVVSACFNYTYNRCIVFHGEASVSSALRYFALATIILCLNSLFLDMLVTMMGVNPYAAKIFVECAMFLLSWMAQGCFVFASK